MLVALLQFEYKIAYATLAVGSPYRVNCVMRHYNPRIQSLYVYDGDTDIPMYLYLSSDYAIQHLSARIQGQNTAKRQLQIGLLHDKPEAKLYNVSLQTNLDNVSFAVVRYANRIYAIDAFFKISGDATEIKLDTAFFTICTRCTFHSKKNSVGKYVLSDSLVRDNFTATKTYLLPKAPAQYVLGCLECTAASGGDSCQECKGDTQKQASGGCECLYERYEFMNFTERCGGVDEIVSNDAITTVDGNVYALECRSRISYTVNISYTAASLVSFSLFNNDECGINNIKLVGNIQFKTTVNESFFGGLVTKLTGSITNITSELVIVHSGASLKRAAAICTTAEASEEYLTISNVTLAGSMSINGTDEKNDPIDYRNIGGIIGRVVNAKVNISGIAINGFILSHTQTMRGVSYFIGSTINATVNAAELIVVPKQNIAGYINVNTEGLEPTIEYCSEDVQKLPLIGSLRVQQLAQVLYQSSNPQPYVQSEYGHRIALAFAQNMNSTMNIKRVLINAYVLGTSSNNWECGLLAADVNSTVMTVIDTFINGTVLNGNSYHGIIARVNRAIDNSIVDLTLSANASFARQIAGVIASQDGCISTLQLYINITQQNQQQGVYGVLKQGTATITALFGNATLSSTDQSCAYIVGSLQNGQVNGYTCASCAVNSIKNSYYGAENDMGTCDNTYFNVKSPVWYNGNSYYFLNCKSNIKVRISCSGYYQVSNTQFRYSTFDSSACSPHDLEVRMEMDFTTASYSSGNSAFVVGVSLETGCDNLVNIKINMSVSFTNGYLERIAALTNDQTRRVSVTNITFSGTIKSEYSGAKKSSSQACGLTCWIAAKATYTRIRIIGLQIQYSYGMRSTMILAHVNTGEQITLTDVIVDDNTADPNTQFDDAVYGRTPDFPCYSSASSDLQLAMRAKNLLKMNNPRGRSTFNSSTPDLTQSGFIFGALDQTNNVQLSKVAIMADYNVPAVDAAWTKLNIGFIAGYITGNTVLTIDQTFISVNLTTNNLALIGPFPGGAQANVILAAEGNWNGVNQKGIFNTLTGGTVTVRAALNISLDAYHSGGIVGSFQSGTLNVLEAVGSISVFGNQDGVQKAFELVGEIAKTGATLNGYDTSQMQCEADAVMCTPKNQCTSATNCKVNTCSP